MLRVIVKPLTEKTEFKPKNDEILVDTENGHISTVDNNENLQSATKDIESGVSLLKTRSDTFNEKYKELVNNPIFTNSGYIGLYNDTLNLLNSVNTIKSAMDNEESITSTFESDLVSLSNIYQKTLEFKEDYMYLINYFRNTSQYFDELEYFVDELNEMLKNIESLKLEVITSLNTLVSLKNKVIKNSDSRATQAEYDEFVSNLKQKYLINLKNNYSIIQSININ